mmetsp:Transcript_19185/g.61021  ORF Transcript_19185/g.61021 Transcript_19185/m.61021 type:complete len:303 (+) Transcript_19185:568-1476(+)
MPRRLPPTSAQLLRLISTVETADGWAALHERGKGRRLCASVLRLGSPLVLIACLSSRSLTRIVALHLLLFLFLFLLLFLLSTARIRVPREPTLADARGLTQRLLLRLGVADGGAGGGAAPSVLAAGQTRQQEGGHVHQLAGQPLVARFLFQLLQPPVCARRADGVLQRQQHLLVGRQPREHAQVGPLVDQQSRANVVVLPDLRPRAQHHVVHAVDVAPLLARVHPVRAHRGLVAVPVGGHAVRHLVRHGDGRHLEAQRQTGALAEQVAHQQLGCELGVATPRARARALAAPTGALGVTVRAS